jgi:AcrR family transcriptional regulator
MRRIIMADQPLPPARPPRTRRKYASPGMSERRQRIVTQAHRILGEGGVQALTIERLSREAGVAPRTLYRLFGDKEGVIFATVSDRLREVRRDIALQRRDYSIAAVFEELDWMVSEMHRDDEYARVVIGFFFSAEPRTAAIRELRSVAYNRVRNWMDREISAGHCLTELDLERIAQDHVAGEFYVYHRWAVGVASGPQCRLELRCAFLRTAILVLSDPVRSDYIALLAAHQRELGAADPTEFAPLDIAEDRGVNGSA